MIGSKKMRGYMGDEKSGTEGAGVAVFLVLIAATVGAFLAADAGAFRSAPTARIAVFPSQDDVAHGTLTEAADPSFTSSTRNVSKAAVPACNYDACAQAFRSFRSSDCSFQPFEGPRRVCTR
jgi:BA14K-like protein